MAWPREDFAPHRAWTDNRMRKSSDDTLAIRSGSMHTYLATHFCKEVGCRS